MTVVNEVSNRIILRNICINSTADIRAKGEFFGNPTECALITAAGKAGIDYKSERKNTVIIYVEPFSSETKYMSTTVGNVL